MLKNFWKRIENFSFEDIDPGYKALLVLPVIFIYIYFVAYGSNHFLHNKERLKMQINNEFKDKVIEKGLDKKNRNTPYLILSKTNFHHEDSLIWSKIDVGDSLIKFKNSSRLKIIKKDTTIIADYKDVYKYWDSIYRSN